MFFMVISEGRQYYTCQNKLIVIPSTAIINLRVNPKDGLPLNQGKSISANHGWSMPE
jgi:hypothetical protein